jgi:hypothetical protein
MNSARQEEGFMTKICIAAAVAAALAVIAPASAFAAGWFQMMSVISEANGFVASILVLTTFTMTDMRTLRVVAIFSNVAFIAYSALEWLPQVLILHLTLLPLNVLRLAELAARGSTPSECDLISPFRSWLRALQADAALEVSRLVTIIRAWLGQDCWPSNGTPLLYFIRSLILSNAAVASLGGLRRCVGRLGSPRHQP